VRGVERGDGLEQDLNAKTPRSQGAKMKSGMLSNCVFAMNQPLPRSLLSTPNAAWSVRSAGLDMTDDFLCDVFLSHGARDKTAARQRLNVWFDEWVHQPGDRDSGFDSPGWNPKATPA